MECFICGKVLKKGYLCKQHAKELHCMLEGKKGIVENPDIRYHCCICGEFKDRTIVEYKGISYFCGLDIEEELKKHQK